MNTPQQGCAEEGAGASVPAPFVSMQRNAKAPTFTTKPALAIGSFVRCWFGPDCHRDGRVEFIREDGFAMVRVSPAWVHAERIERIEVLAPPPPAPVKTAAQLRWDAAHDSSCVGAFARARP